MKKKCEHQVPINDLILEETFEGFPATIGFISCFDRKKGRRLSSINEKLIRHVRKTKSLLKQLDSELSEEIEAVRPFRKISFVDEISSPLVQKHILDRKKEHGACFRDMFFAHLFYRSHYEIHEIHQFWNELEFQFKKQIGWTDNASIAVVHKGAYNRGPEHWEVLGHDIRMDG